MSDELPFQAASDTSQNAAIFAGPYTGDARRLIWNWLREHRAATAEGISKALGTRYDSVKPRLLELVERGLVVRCASPARTSTGARANLYQAVEVADADARLRAKRKAHPGRLKTLRAAVEVAAVDLQVADECAIADCCGPVVGSHIRAALRGLRKALADLDR